MSVFNYISFLRLSCDPVEGCDECACFPACLEGTELSVAIGGYGPDGSITCPGCDGTLSFSNLDGSYTLAYLGSSQYSIVLADIADPDDIRANGILLWRQVCGGDEQETYIYKIDASLGCDSGDMGMAVTVNHVCLHLISGDWEVDTHCFGWATPSLAACLGGSPATTVPMCSRESMTQSWRYGDITWDGSCNIHGDCSSPDEATVTGAIS